MRNAAVALVALALANGCGGGDDEAPREPETMAEDEACSEADDWRRQLLEARAEDGFSDGPCQLSPATRAALTPERAAAYDTACASYEDAARRCEG